MKLQGKLCNNITQFLGAERMNLDLEVDGYGKYTIPHSNSNSSIQSQGQDGLHTKSSAFKNFRKFFKAEL